MIRGCLYAGGMLFVRSLFGGARWMLIGTVATIVELRRLLRWLGIADTLWGAAPFAVVGVVGHRERARVSCRDGRRR